MDIEEAEYEVLTFESSNTLKKFSCMIIEFHALHNLFERHFFQMVSSIFEKIYEDFYIYHAHPNNQAGISCQNGIEVPGTLEITFIRRDLVSKADPKFFENFPHTLDRKNNKDLPEIVLPEYWQYKKKIINIFLTVKNKIIICIASMK